MFLLPNVISFLLVVTKIFTSLTQQPIDCLLFRERRDLEHAALMEQKMKEEADIREALHIQDEIMAKKMQNKEAEKCDDV